MAKRAYPRKPESEKRIPFTLSLSGDRLKRFREAAELKEGGNLSNRQLKEIAEQVAYVALDAYCESAENAMIAKDGAIIL